MKVFQAAISLFCLLAVTQTSAIEADLTLQQAIDFALKQNPTVLAARSESDASASAFRNARSLANPEVIITPGVTGTGASDEELLITQPLEINGQRRVRSRIAAFEAEASRASARAVEREVVRDVKQVYWDVALAGAVVELARLNVEFAESVYTAAKRQVDVGAAAGSRVIKTEVELARTRQELTAAETDLAKSKATLDTLMGRPPDTPIELADKLSFKPVEVKSEGAGITRPEIVEARALLEARRNEIRAAKVRRLPDLALQARQETLGEEGGLAVGVTLPIFDWGSIRHDRRRAESEAAAQEQRLAAMTNAVHLDVQTALYDVRRAETQVREYERGLLSQSERLADMAQKGFKAGATGYLEVLEAQRTLRSVRADYYTALADHMKAMAQLEWASGSDLPKIALKEVKQ
jgi:cobalt-zinc-cadmium efflux system outer membrane protein